MRYTTKTMERRIVGPYHGKRISGTSDEVFDVTMTIEYDFANFKILVVDVPAHWDRVQNRQLIHGKIGIELNRKVNEVAAILERRQSQQRKRGQSENQVRDLLEQIPLSVALSAPEFLRDAA